MHEAIELVPSTVTKTYPPQRGSPWAGSLSRAGLQRATGDRRGVRTYREGCIVYWQPVHQGRIGVVRPDFGQMPTPDNTLNLVQDPRPGRYKDMTTWKTISYIGVVILSTLGFACGCTQGYTPTQQEPPAIQGQIAFTSPRDTPPWDRNSEIYVMNANGTDVTRLTNSSGDDWLIAWSPDGTRIAFQSNRDGNDEIYVMNADGTGVTRLTNNSVDDLLPAWSPDGTRIAFMSDWEIYVMNADGTDLTMLTNNSAYDLLHAWSPDGTRIAFQSDRDGNDEVYVMNADGTGVTRLTNNLAEDRSPVWSPDGTRIAFTSERDRTDEIYRDRSDEIYVINADGTGLTRLTDNSVVDIHPAWSPDGTRIAFTSDSNWYSEIYVINADGTGLTRLTDNPVYDWLPVWSPDGAYIAFQSNRNGNDDIYVMNADGTGQARLTRSYAADGEPAWKP